MMDARDVAPPHIPAPPPPHPPTHPLESHPTRSFGHSRRHHFSAVPSTGLTDSSPSLSPSPACAHRYAQTVGSTVYLLKINGATGEFTGSANGTLLFSCTVGARVVTTLSGEVTALVGITPSTINVTLTVNAASSPDHRPGENQPENQHEHRPEDGVTKGSVARVSVSLAPNAEYDVKLDKVVRSAPYTPPFD